MRYVYHINLPNRDVYLYGIDDRKAKRWLAAWLGLLWPRYAAHIRDKHPGSMARGFVDGWGGIWGKATVRRATLLPVDVIPCEGWVTLEHFELSPEPIREYRRVFRGWGRP